MNKIKFLQSENLQNKQEIDFLKKQKCDFESENSNFKNQIEILEKKILLYEKETNLKLSSMKGKVYQYEQFNKELFNKISFYE